MKKIFLTIFASSVLMAQVAGTISKTTSTSIKAVSNTLTCTFTHGTPDTTYTSSVTCSDSADSAYNVKQDTTLPEGGTAVGSANKGADSVTWIIQHKPGSALLDFQIAANGTLSTGTF